MGEGAALPSKGSSQVMSPNRAQESYLCLSFYRRLAQDFHPSVHLRPFTRISSGWLFCCFVLPSVFKNSPPSLLTKGTQSSFLCAVTDLKLQETFTKEFSLPRFHALHLLFFFKSLSGEAHVSFVGPHPSGGFDMFEWF